MTAQSQRDIFVAQLHEQTGLPKIRAIDRNKFFQLLYERVKDGKKAGLGPAFVID